MIHCFFFLICWKRSIIPLINGDCKLRIRDYSCRKLPAPELFVQIQEACKFWYRKFCLSSENFDNFGLFSLLDCCYFPTVFTFGCRAHIIYWRWRPLLTMLATSSSNTNTIAAARCRQWRKRCRGRRRHCTRVVVGNQPETITVVAAWGGRRSVWSG